MTTKQIYHGGRQWQSQWQSQRQSGTALLVAMVMIFMMSVLGITAMRESSLEKRMTTNSVHKSTTFQTAESATDIALGSPEKLSAAFTSNGDSLTIYVPASINTEMKSGAALRYMGSGPPIGFSLGSGGGFQALRFVAEGTAAIDAVQSASTVHQGAYRTVPALSQ